ncbi:hypothetical protein DPMN_038919 [Dreissena polymorpha]|uniref:Uncharacterized protein n=1 Tax=Dreissena polymorpha TaxID=45954 RepID=A0A9D4MG77_DREPO|nr:hypothetical protein DPMN_038919 [Dreissena polymorpha]
MTKATVIFRVRKKVMLEVKRPDVVVTEAEVHHSFDETEDMDKIDDYPKHFQQHERERKENRSRSVETRGHREERSLSSREGRMVQSQQNLTQLSHQEIQDDLEYKRSRSQGQIAQGHFTPTLVRKGNDYGYEIPGGANFAENSLGHSANDLERTNSRMPSTSAIPKSSSVLDVSRETSRDPFTMPEGFQASQTLA